MYLVHYLWRTDAWSGKESGGGTQPCSNYTVLVSISILPFDNYAAEEYGKVRADLERKGTPIGPMDMLIAGHARSEGLILVTNNTREFFRVDDLEVEDWTKE